MYPDGEEANSLLQSHGEIAIIKNENFFIRSATLLGVKGVKAKEKPRYGGAFYGWVLRNFENIKIS